MEMAADLAREDLREMAARVDSVETETVMAREDLQDREIPRTEDHLRAVRDVSQEKTVTTEVRDALADRITRDSVPAAQDEAAVDLMQCLHRS